MAVAAIRILTTIPTMNTAADATHIPTATRED